MTYSSSSSPEISAAPAANTPEQFSYKHASHDEVLEDLSSRFILNLPDEELASLERICFQVEQAHWYYEDFVREENPKFPSLPLKKFSAMLFHACPLLHQWSHDHEQAFNTFMQYKTRVPVCGAIMLNDTWEKCLLVKGWKSSSGWGFPKGKINQDEPEPNCAIREVLEETGYNLAGQIIPENVIEMSIREQKISLYIVPGVPEDFPFKTKTRKEISKIEWFRLTDLPTWKRSKASIGKFYLISPFIGALKTFINERKPRGAGRKVAKARNCHPSSRKDEGSPTLQSYATDQDHTQESSSQSSADPQTPSPHYTESVSSNTMGPGIAGDHVSKVTALETFDPHFARLLSSLSISASAMQNKDKTVLPPSLSITTRESTPPEPTTPIPISAITASSANSHPLSEPTDQVDWSSSVPKRLVNRSATRLPSHSPTENRSSFTSPRSFQPIPPKNPPNNSHARSGLPSDQIFPPSATLPSSPPPPPRRHSRRTSSTTDISPYLCRSVEVPTSGKQLKQLALLESVADESARMRPNLDRQQEANNHYGAMLHFAPDRPGRLPPVVTQANRGNDPHIIYTSGPGPDHTFNTPTHSESLQDDVFRVRPQTSHEYHRGPTFMTSPVENQFQFPSAYPHPSHTQGHYRPLVAPPLGTPGSHTTSQPMNHARVVSLLGPALGVPHVFDKSAYDPRSNNNAKLLSILNGSPATGATSLALPAMGHR